MSISKRQRFFLGFVALTLIFIAFFSNFILNVSHPLGKVEGVSSDYRPQGFYRNDAYLVNFMFEHILESAVQENFSGISTTPMFYGFEGSLFFTDHHLLHAVFALPIYLITQDAITTSNFIILGVILASLYAMYYTAYFYFKNMLISVISAVVFVLNPYVMAHFPEQLILFSLMWIPLVFLFSEKALRDKSDVFTFLAFFFLTLQLFTSFYYFAMLTIFLPVYIVVRIWQQKIKLSTLPKKGVLIGVIFLFLALLINWHFYSRATDGLDLNRGVSVSRLYSASVTDWLFTSPQNLVYGGLKERAAQNFPDLVSFGIYSEHSLFPGIVVITLLLLGFFMVKGEDRKIWKVFLAIFLLSLLFSFGPFIYISQNISIPSPYLIIKILHPMFEFMRVPARFGLFAFFSMSMLVGLCLLSIKNRTKWINFVFFAILVMILFEYWQKPLDYYEISSEEREFYSALSSDQSIEVIIDYPIANRIEYPNENARAEELDAIYMLYAVILHDKKLFNGNSGYIPPLYLERADFLSQDFPKPEQIDLLRHLGVDGLVLHRSEFNFPDQYEEVMQKLNSLGIETYYKTENLSLFKISRS